MDFMAAGGMRSRFWGYLPSFAGRGGELSRPSLTCTLDGPPADSWLQQSMQPNPKHEYLNSTQIQMTQVQDVGRYGVEDHRTGLWSFVFGCCLGFSASDLGFPLLDCGRGGEWVG